MSIEKTLHDRCESKCELCGAGGGVADAHSLESGGLAQDLLDMLYLDEEILTWAQATG